MLRIRAYRAIEDYASCAKFAEGHSNVLKSYGIKQVTSSNTDWFYNSGVYVIVLESTEDNKVYGGTRIHVANGYQPLPLEEALGNKDKKVDDLIKNASVDGTGELCGLWNAREVSGKGYSVLLTEGAIAEAGIVFAQQLKLNSLFVLCAPWTVDLVRKYGFIDETSIGNEGAFEYPTPDLIAKLLVIKNTETLEHANTKERERIFDLRKNTRQKRLEVGTKESVMIEYDLSTFKNR